MKRVGVFAVLLGLLGAVVAAHGNNEHVRGVVKAMTGTSVTVQVSDQVVKTLALTGKTTYEKSGKAATLADLKVGDRVIIDVPKGTTDALEIRFGAAPKKGS